jgi:hypothetical protein
LLCSGISRSERDLLLKMLNDESSTAMVSTANAASASGGEDVVSKYKRLLSMARSSLEANQAQLASKDQQIAQLLAALEDEKSKRGVSKALKDDDAYQYPRRIICRVDVEGVIWILIEYDSCPDEWKSFSDEESLADFIQRMPGVPLVCPQTRLSAAESARVVCTRILPIRFCYIIINNNDHCHRWTKPTIALKRFWRSFDGKRDVFDFTTELFKLFYR